MFLNLTNAVEQLRGERIILNSNSIVSVFAAHMENESEETRTVTIVHCPPHGSWEVEETVEQIAELLKDH